MAPIVVRPSFKFIQLGFIAVIVVVIAAGVVQYEYRPKGELPWLPIIAALLILWPLAKALRRRFTKIVIEGERLYYEQGALSKQTRIIQVHKIQDVRVHQSLGQRMFGVGDLSIETAGEASRLTISSIDQPRPLAEKILELANQHGATQL
jgi:uncharacterized membrane protein YdbT with pleckstrin-like domain